jgi:small-conductance mechanosensitive channel
MENILDKVFIEPFRGFASKVAQFLPSLLTGLVLIVTGLVVAWLLKTVCTAAAQFLKADAVSEKIGLSQALQKAGIKEQPSRLLGKAVYWVVLISFVIMGLDAVKVPAVEQLLSEFFLYLPNMIVAAIILVLGYLVGNFLGRAALIASVNAGLFTSGLVAKFVKYGVFAVALSMALELLGIGKDTIIVAFAIVFGGVVLALAIAFGQGGRAAAEKYIEKRLQQKEDKGKDEIEHI